jgi:hypothetical protein
MTFISPNSDDINIAKNQLRNGSLSFNRIDNDVLTGGNAFITPSVVSQPNYKRVEFFTDNINSRYSF